MLISAVVIDWINAGRRSRTRRHRVAAGNGCWREVQLVRRVVPPSNPPAYLPAAGGVIAKVTRVII